MESAAQAEEFEQTLQQANDLSTKVDAYLAAVKDLEEKKQQYEDALAKLKAKLEGMPKTDYPKLATMKQDIDTVKGQMESAAQSGDYEQALAKTNDLTTKVDAYATAVKELEEKKKAYEGGFEAIKPKLAEALQSKNPDVAPVQKELLISKQQMEEAAKNGDYAQANTSLADVTAKVATIQAAKPEAGGGGLIPGITLEGEFPVGEFEQDAWGGKIKVTYKLKAIISAKLGSASSLKVVIDKDGLTGKVAVTVWESHGKLSLGGVDVFKDPKFEVKGKINKGGAEVKAEYSTDTPIGKASVAASLAEIKVGEKIKIGKLGGKLEGRPIQCGDVSIDGFEIKDIKATFTGEIEIGPDWINIVARKLAEEVIERGAADVGMELAIEGGLLVVVVGTILGSINELSKASDERELVAFVFRACNEYKQGMTNALAGKPKSGSGWLLLGWTYGSKKFVDLCADMKIDHPDQNEIEIHDAVANRSQQNASKYEGPANYDVGIQFWRTWVRDHHGPTTFPQHAKTAYLACFGRQATGSEPDFQLWVKAAK